VAELDGSNNVLSTFVYGLKPNVPDYMVHGGTTYRIVSDWRGDVRLVLDTTKTGSAAVVQQIDYDEWGNVTNLVDPACTVGGTELCFQPFGFAGGIWEPATQIVRFGARDYDPLVRRWVSKDPRRFRGGLNLYRYAKDDPINYSDSTGRNPLVILGEGLCPECVGILIIGGFLNELLTPPVCQATSPSGDRPNGLPTGTLPIDQIGLTRDQIHGIKQGYGIGAKQWAGIAPDGTIWVNDGTGNAEEVGCLDPEDSEDAEENETEEE
jgi:RHS repeat-associated protein